MSWATSGNSIPKSPHSPTGPAPKRCVTFSLFRVGDLLVLNRAHHAITKLRLLSILILFPVLGRAVLSVTFYDATTVLGAATLSGAQATLTTVMLASGTRAIRAYYSGNATYLPGSSTPSLPLAVAPGSSLGFNRA